MANVEFKAPSSYSIYKSKRQRVVCHVLFWILFCCYQLSYNLLWLDLKNDFSSYFVMDYIFDTLYIAIFYYYLIFLMRFVKSKKYWVVIVGFGLLLPMFYYLQYLTYALSSLNPNTAKTIKPYFTILKKRPIYGLHSLLHFVSIIFWGLCLPLSIKFLVAIFENVQNQRRMKIFNDALQLENASKSIPSEWIDQNLSTLYSETAGNHEAQSAVGKLKELLDFAYVRSHQKTVPLQDEIQFLSNYIAFEQMRQKASRVLISFTHDLIENPDVEIPPLLFVNFIENAFKHGINSTAGKAWVKIELTQQENLLHFHIENSLPTKVLGMKSVHDTGGIGLDNVKKRMELEFPNRYTLETYKKDIFEVDLKINLL